MQTQRLFIDHCSMLIRSELQSARTGSLSRPSAGDRKQAQGFLISFQGCLSFTALLPSAIGAFNDAYCSASLTPCSKVYKINLEISNCSIKLKTLSKVIKLPCFVFGQFLLKTFTPPSACCTVLFRCCSQRTPSSRCTAEWLWFSRVQH